MLKLYDNCLIFILEKNISIDRLPSTIQKDIFALKKYCQAKCTFVEKWRAVESESDWNSFWWEDKLENIGSYLPSKIHWFFSFYIEFFKSLLDKQVNIGQKAYDFPKVSQAAFENERII